MIQRIDSHQHFWRLARGDLAWLRTDLPALAPLLQDLAETDSIAVSDSLIGELSPNEQSALWRGNAARFYQLGSP